MAPTFVVGRRAGERLESGERAAVTGRSSRCELKVRRRTVRLVETRAKRRDDTRVRANVGAGAVSAGSEAGVDGDSAMTVDGVKVFDEPPSAGALTLSQAA